MYRALEFHDSTLLAVIPGEATLHLVLTGYIHQWERTGKGWVGTGWTQQVRIQVDEPRPLTLGGELPADLWTGWIRTSDQTVDNLVQLPFQAEGACMLYLRASTGETTIVRGNRLSVVTENEPEFVENLPEDLRPEWD